MHGGMRMPKNRIFRVKNLDELYGESYEPVIVNDAGFTNKHVIGEFVKQLFLDMEQDLDYISSCECGAYRGNYFEGSTCPYCGTVVSSKFTTSVSNTHWLGIPDDLPAVIHPACFYVLKQWLGKTRSTKEIGNKKKIPVIQAILDPSAVLPDEFREIVPVQGQTYFNQHWKEILSFFLHDYKYKKNNKLNPYINYMLEKYEDLFLVRKLPILHSSLHPLIREGKIRTVDSTSSKIMPAIVNLSYAANAVRRMVTHKRQADKAIWGIYSKYIEYCMDIVTKKVSEKFGHCRRHIVGSRVMFSARCVIVPITTRHSADECHIPWQVAVSVYKYEILNVLVNRKGYSFNDAIAKHAKSIVAYDQDIMDIMNTLMKEAGGMRLFPIGRNPTLIHGSIMLFNAKIKKDIHDHCISMPPTSIKNSNADFDGDALWKMDLKERAMLRKMGNLHPREFVLSKNSLGLSGAVTMTDEAFIHWTAFMNDIKPEEYEYDFAM